MKKKAIKPFPAPKVSSESSSESNSSRKNDIADVSSGSDWDANAEDDEADDAPFDEEAEETDAEDSEGGDEEESKEEEQLDADVRVTRRMSLAGRSSQGAGGKKARKRKRELGSEEDADSDEEDLASRKKKLGSGRALSHQIVGGECKNKLKKTSSGMKLRPRVGRGEVVDERSKKRKRGGKGAKGSGTEEDEQEVKSAGKERKFVKPHNKFLQEKWTLDEVEDAEGDSSGSLDSFIAGDDELEEGGEAQPMTAPLSTDEEEEEEQDSRESDGTEGDESIPENDKGIVVRHTDSQPRRGVKVGGSCSEQVESTVPGKINFGKRRRRSVVDDDAEEEEREEPMTLLEEVEEEVEEIAAPRKQGRLRREGSIVKPVQRLTGRRCSTGETVSVAERVERHRKRVLHGESEGDTDAEGAEGSKSESEENLEDDLGEEEDAFVVPDAEGRTYGYGGSDQEHDAEEEEEDEDEHHPAGLKASRDDFRVYLVYIIKCIQDPDFKQLARTSRDSKECFNEVVRKAEEDVVVTRSSVVSSKAWQPRMKVALQTRPLLTQIVINSTHRDGDCDACKRSDHSAPHRVTLEGPPYDPNEIWEVQRTEEEMQAVITQRKAVAARRATERGEVDEEAEIFHLGSHCFTRCQMYHVLHHYKPRLIARLTHELDVTQKRKDPMEYVLSNERGLVRKLYQNYKKMVLLANKFLSTETTRFGHGQEEILRECDHLVEEIRHSS